MAFEDLMKARESVLSKTLYAFQVKEWTGQLKNEYLENPADSAGKILVFESAEQAEDWKQTWGMVPKFAVLKEVTGQDVADILEYNERAEWMHSTYVKART